MRARSVFGIVSMIVVVMACSAAPEDPGNTTAAGGSVRPQGQSVALGGGTTGPAVAGVGYVHSVGKSRFRIGQNVHTELNNATIIRWRGSLGAFAQDPTNGWTMALLDSTTPTGPYYTDEVAHAAAVKAYFIAAGIPANEVGDVKSNFEFGGGGSISDPAAPPEFRSVSSVVYRVVSGIPVPESYAWAKMTTNGDVDAESVYWPTIDASDVAKAVAFANALAAPGAKTAFLAKLPGQVVRDGGVMLHVTHWSMHTTATAIVSYDAAVDPWPQAAMRHFDVNGVEIRLPHESVKAVGHGTKP